MENVETDRIEVFDFFFARWRFLWSDKHRRSQHGLYDAVKIYEVYPGLPNAMQKLCWVCWLHLMYARLGEVFLTLAYMLLFACPIRGTLLPQGNAAWQI